MGDGEATRITDGPTSRSPERRPPPGVALTGQRTTAQDASARFNDEVHAFADQVRRPGIAQLVARARGPVRIDVAAELELGRVA